MLRDTVLPKYYPAILPSRHLRGMKQTTQTEQSFSDLPGAVPGIRQDDRLHLRGADQTTGDSNGYHCKASAIFASGTGKGTKWISRRFAAWSIVIPVTTDCD